MLEATGGFLLLQPDSIPLQVGNRYTNIIYKVMISQFITFLSEGHFLAYKVKVAIDEVEFGMANIAFFVGIGFIAVLDLAIPHSYIAEESITRKAFPFPY